MPGGPSSRPTTSLRFRRIRALTVLVALIVVVTVIVQLARGGSSGAGPESALPSSPAAGPTSAAREATAPGPSADPAEETSAPPEESSGPPEQPAAPTAEAAAAALEEAAEKRTDGVSGRLAVSVLDLQTGVAATYGPEDRTFATASIVKVDILATLLWQKDGKLSDSDKAYARQMIRTSDNNAATVLWTRIGRAKGLAEANREFGLTSTKGGTAGYWGLTMTTATDQTRLLQNIFTDDTALNSSSQKYLKSLMGTVALDQDWGVSAADTRSGEDYFVKNGWLPRSKGRVVNSIGAVEHDGHQLLIAALSDGRTSMGTGVRVVERVSEDAAEAVTGS